jgi:hypothetical protein
MTDADLIEGVRSRLDEGQDLGALARLLQELAEFCLLVHRVDERADDLAMKAATSRREGR